MAQLAAWTLHVVVRCESLQTLLTRSDHASLCAALSESNSSGGVAAATPASAAQSAQTAGSDAPSSHLERWKQWKLDDAHIERLTSAYTAGTGAPSSSPSAPLSFLSDWIKDARFFARGKRGVLYAGELQSNGAGVVVKLGAASVELQARTVSSLSPSSVDAEAKWLRVMNRMGIGAQLVASGPGWFICERLEGQHVVNFLGDNGGASSHANARWVLREMLCQCFAMDLMGINKEEMTHPHRHIIIHTRPAAADTSGEAAPTRTWKCTFIDFEKCVFTRKPKNVTQLCQFLSSPRMVSLFGAKGVAFEIQKLRLATKRYKQSPRERTFSELMHVFGL